MMRRTLAGLATLLLVLTGAHLGHANPPLMSDYTALPPFTTKVAPPNIMLIMDTSGSLNTAAYNGQTFDPAKVYSGLFEPTECYKRNSGRFEPEPAADPSSPGTCTNATYPWSGNLLNFGTMRRIDIVKRVLTGGLCSTTRDAAGYCPPGSSNYIKGQDTFLDAGYFDWTLSVSAANATGRVPASVLSGLSGTLYFHLVARRTSAPLSGSFCLDNDSTTPLPTASDCGDTTDAYNEKVLEPKFEIRVQFTTPQGGVIQQVGDQARIGLMTFNDTNEGSGVRNYIGANLPDIITNIDAGTPYPWTPLAESVYEAARYFAQIPPAYSNTPADYVVAQANDPYYFQAPKWASTTGYVDCCKSYVILFTDGVSTADQSIPVGLQDLAHSIHGAHCSPPSPYKDPCSPHKEIFYDTGSHFLDDVAYWAHTTDLRQATIPVLVAPGKDLPGFQNLTIYTFYAFGEQTGRELLQSAAKAGGFEDQNGNKLPDLTAEWDKLNNLTGAATPDGIPDAYFESANADDLKDRLLGAVYSILKRSASGTAASVLASSTTGEGAAYQAYFYPHTSDVSGDVKWTGYLHSLWVDAFGNFREDTVADGRLVYQNDKIVVTRYDTTAGEVLVDRYADADGDGKADSTSCSPCGVALKNLAPIWEAGQRLALKNSADRNILTWVDSNDDGLVDAGEQMAFSTANSSTLAPYVLAEGSGADPFTANNIINFIRGDQITGLRNRDLQVPPGSGTLKVWKLGDIVNSTPVIVGAPKERYDVIYGDGSYTDYFTKYKNRRMVAYVGANDGMLHAFNVGYYHRGDDASTTTANEHGWITRTATDDSGGPLLGEELWGFIPYHLLPQLQWLAREDYGHTYYVDLKAKVTDARIFTADTDHPNGWGTILIGGMRLGGSCKDCQAGNGKEVKFKPSGSGPDHFFYSAYFVLDITNPEVDPKLLWSLIDDKLQFTTSYPAVLRVSPLADGKTDNTNAKWFAMFGSGPTGYTGASSQEGYVYIVDLKLGPGDKNKNVVKDASGYGSSFIGDIISVDANLDYRADVSYFGSVRDTGSTPKWEGKLFRMTTSNSGAAPFGGSTNPSNWGASNKPTWFLYDFGCSPSPFCSGSKKPGPMSTAPTVTLDDSLNVWVFGGTGRYWTLADKSLTETEYFFGVKDDTMNGTCTQGSDVDCQQKELVNVSAATVCSTCASGTNQVTDSNNTGVTTLTGTATTTLQGLVASKEGWYTTLPTSGERALYSPTLFGGIVFFPTFVPDTGGVCSGGTGTSSLYALFYLTGSAYKVSVVGTDTVGGNTNVKRSTALGAAVASQVGIHMGAQGTDAGTGITSRSKVCSQMSTGALTCLQTQPALVAWSRYLSWINLRQ